MRKTAVFADLHLLDNENTVKEDVLKWALQTCKSEAVQLIVCIGDMLGYGQINAAKRLRLYLDNCGIDWLFTPGNAELRYPQDTEAVLQTLASPSESKDAILLDTSSLRLSESAKELLQKNSPAQVYAYTHCPPEYWTPEDAALLQDAIDRGKVAKIISAHRHFDSVKGKQDMLRGLDPDKAMGGPPAFVVYDGKSRQEFAYQPADPRLWSSQERRHWLAHLGCSGYRDPFGVLERTRGLAMPALELSYSNTHDWNRLGDLVKAWRQEGGTWLSLHMPTAAWLEGKISGAEDYKRGVELAMQLGCDRVTIHPPKVQLQDFERSREQFGRFMRESLKPLLQAGRQIGLENVHMNPGENCAQRRFGYTPPECRLWIEELRQGQARPELVGFHFDIGHARNNGEYSWTWPISSWLAELGAEINGYHLHQVSKASEEKLRNHFPLTELFGRMISLGSLFLAWRKGQARQAPMFLEIREESSDHSYMALRSLLQ